MNNSAKSSPVQIEIAQAFFDALDISGPVTFQTFDDNQERDDRKLAKKRYGTLEQHAKWLEEMNAKGAGVFFTVNQTKGTNRKTEDIAATRGLLFADYDDRPYDGKPGNFYPRVVVDTSPGKNHIYWRVDDVPMGQFTPAQKRIAEIYKTDNAVTDLPRVMRLPGFCHRKGEPHLVTFKASETAPVYGWEEFSSALELDTNLAPKRKLINFPKVVWDGERHEDMNKFLASLRARGATDEELETKGRKRIEAYEDGNHKYSESEFQAQLKWARNLPHYEALTEALTEDSSSEEIEKALVAVRPLSAVRLDKALKVIKKHTGIGLGALRKMIKASSESGDLGDVVMRATLDKSYAGGDYLIVVDSCCWVYTGSHWERVPDELVKCEVIKAARHHLDGGATLSSLTNQAMNLIEGEQALGGDPLRLRDTPLPVINCRNGELWLDPFDFRPEHSHDSYLTSCLDVDYDPKAKCPLFDETVLEIFSENEEMVRHWNEVMGYALQPDRWLQVFLILYGDGENGKSKLVETITNLCGLGYTVQDRVSTLGKNQFMVGNLVGKLLFIDDDVDEGTWLPDGIMKKLSGNTPMTGDVKHKKHIEFRNCTLPILCANNWPQNKDLSWGTRRRAHVLPFRERFMNERERADEEARRFDNAKQLELLGKEAKTNWPKLRLKDPKRFERIWKEEMSGVLNRAIEGLLRLRERGELTSPQPCKNAYQEWLSNSNPLMAFLHEECELGPGYRQTTKAFYRSYVAWANEWGVKALSRRNLSEKLKSLGYAVEKACGEYWVMGVVAAEPEPMNREEEDD